MNNEIRKLPLWRNCVDELLQMPLGSEIQPSFFERGLSIRSSAKGFSPKVGRIRLELLKHGRYLKQRRGAFILCDRRETARKLVDHARISKRRTKRLIQFSGSIDTTGLSEEERRTIAKIGERAAIVLVLQSRRGALPQLQYTGK